MHKETLMKSVMHGGLALVLVLGLSGIAAAEVHWKGGDAPTTDGAATSGAPAPGATFPADSTAGGTPAPAGGANVKLEKVAAPVKKVLTRVEAAQKQLEEATKAIEKQNAAKLRGLKETIAGLYLTAAQTAKAQSATFKGDDKQAFLDQYDKPNREKAISLLLELANEALAMKDYRNADSLARRALAIDPKNTDIEALLKKIAEEKAAPAKGTSKSNNSKKDTNQQEFPNRSDR